MLENNEEISNEKEDAENKVSNSSEIFEETIQDEVNTVNTIEDAVEEIEKSVAEDAEKDKPKEKENPSKDYSQFSLEELVVKLKSIIKNNPIQKIKSEVDAIKSTFNHKFSILLTQKKEAFLADGGNSIDFYFSNPVKSEYNALLSEYKKKRDAHYKDLEKLLSENLEKRVEVINNLKRLIEDADSSTMYKKFRDLENTWRTIGPVSKTKYNDTWKIYHHHVERFYDLLHLSNDLRDLDFKHNLEEKIKIIEKAEALINEENINVAFKKLQNLHKAWKEDIGPVAKELREEIWQKFSEATKKIHDKRHAYYRSMRSKFKEIFDKKTEIIDAIDAYDTSNNTSHNDWQSSIKDIEDLRNQYFNAGKLSYAKNEQLWKKFKVATKKFNKAKNTFYKQEKIEEQKNLEKKRALIAYAESLKDSEDWEETTIAMKKVQEDWKKIGHVPRKLSNDIWKRFKAACNYYFDRYHKEKNEISKEDQEIIDAKREYLESLKTHKNPSKDFILEAINTWKNLGRLPRNVRHLESKFNKQINTLLDNLSMNKREITFLKYTTQIDSYASDNDTRKLDSEQQFVKKKIDEITREIQQLENNLGFFSSSKENNPLLENVKTKVNEFKEDLVVWKNKLDYIKKIDY